MARTEFQLLDEPIFTLIVKERNPTTLVYAVKNLTGATNVKIVFQKPSSPNSPIEVTGTLSGTPTDGKVIYDTNGSVDVVLNDDGRWEIKAKGIDAAGRNFTTKAIKFMVKG